jgi:signal transduction histidine kinase
MVQSDLKHGDANRQVSARFLRQLSLALLGGILLMTATVLTTWWMAGQQDQAARAASRRMVAGGIEEFVERSKATLLDYAIWTEAYDNIRAGNLEWMYRNIGSSAHIGTFDMVLVLPPAGPPLGWEAGSGPAPMADLLDPAAVDAALGLLEGIPVDQGVARATYVRSGGALWLLAVARVAPQEGVPEGAGDADLPRLITGYRVSTEALGEIRRRFTIDDLGVGFDPVPGMDALALAGDDGAALGYASWTAPTPGRAVLGAALGPLAVLMLVVGSVAVLVSRELVRSARRLEGALAQVRAADRIKTEFLGNVSHELRTPLNGVIGMAQLLQLRDQDPESREMLDILMASARTQLDLVNRLLDSARLEAGAMTLDRTPFDPAAALEEVVRLIAPDVERKGIDLRVAIAPEARRPLLGDALAFRQIAANLIGNAAKFTESGGIAVELGPREGGALTLVVADTGPGIDPAEHERIFERFVQVDDPATRGFGGTGLGLAITRAFAELMGGKIRVDSAVGRGATFTVVLPLPAAPAGMAAAAA